MTLVGTKIRLERTVKRLVSNTELHGLVGKVNFSGVFAELLFDCACIHGHWLENVQVAIAADHKSTILEIAVLFLQKQPQNVQNYVSM